MRRPSIIVPYLGPTTSEGEQDVAVYLRPESNGIRVESVVLRELRRSDRLREMIRLVYLANVPGSTIAERGVVAEHYASRVYFARAGGRGFTPGMRAAFESAFKVPFAGASTPGAFEAMGMLGLDAEGLFDVWVPPEQVAVILGQNVKHHAGHYIVNYDIPALLAKHNDRTDVFSMLLRSRVRTPELLELMGAVERALRQERILAEATPIGRVFHFSRGPFEQILDALGYLYAADGSPVPVGEMSFARYLLSSGVDEARILQIVRNPLVRIVAPDGSSEEAEIFEHTRGDSYAAALAKLRSVGASIPLPA